MRLPSPSITCLTLVVAVHATALAGVFYFGKVTPPTVITPPTIQGSLVAAPPEVVPPPPEPPPPPPPEPPPPPKPKPKPKPVPKAPPSERAVKAPEPEPPPPPVVQQPQPAVEAPPAPPAPAPIVQPRADANHLNNPAPIYPTQSRRLREEGTVMLEILVKSNGTVGEVKLKTSSGYKRLDEAAMKAVARWRFVPATQGGNAIDYWYLQDLEFKLH